jgi:hypothetical protein
MSGVYQLYDFLVKDIRLIEDAAIAESIVAGLVGDGQVFVKRDHLRPRILDAVSPHPK